ncbi:heavy-metal-associated domain-containing protein [Natronobacterium texcoconense]|uniref:Copper chaperone n=1 Tax=Natronobacterium texcoconense TaxID=1095778 RepID=A0A1H1EK03_NATTX|nr:cation transporter [Natronobacterium texcoconense]SDQ88779.1 copper chaperone [Natronobacterium texcoconense]
MEQTTLEVEGMACGGCEETVVDALEALSGVSSATADHDSGEVRVEHDEDAVDEGTISTTIENAGYEPAV